MSSETTSRGTEDMFNAFLYIFHVNNTSEPSITKIIWCNVEHKLVEDPTSGNVPKHVNLL